MPRRTAAQRGWAPGGNYGYNTGGPLKVTQYRPKVVAAPTTGYAPGGVPTVLPGQKPPRRGVGYAPIPPGSQVGPGGGGFPTPSTPGINIPGAADPRIQLTPGNPGFTPDYGGIIKRDPGYLAAVAAAKRAEADAFANRREAIRSAFVRYGGDLTGWTDKYGDIDQATRDLAAGNQYSTLASLSRDMANNQRAMRQQLAARGMLQSGELGFGENQLNVGYGQARYQAGQELGQEFGRSINDYAGVLGQNARDLRDAIFTATSNAYQNPANMPVAKKEATYADYDAERSAARGRAVYRGPDGTYYYADGSPV